VPGFFNRSKNIRSRIKRSGRNRSWSVRRDQPGL